MQLLGKGDMPTEYFLLQGEGSGSTLIQATFAYSSTKGMRGMLKYFFPLLGTISHYITRMNAHPAGVAYPQGRGSVLEDYYEPCGCGYWDRGIRD